MKKQVFDNKKRTLYSLFASKVSVEKPSGFQLIRLSVFRKNTASATVSTIQATA